MKKRTIFLLALSVALTLVTSIDSVLAYFFSYAHAAGGYTIELGANTHLEEDFFNKGKHVIITNDPDSQPVYVRVKAFAGSACELTYTDESGLWSLCEDGYYHYGEILEAGKSTAELIINISNFPSGAKEGESFNVVVIYETSSVVYEEDGTAHSDWDRTIDTDMEGSGEGGSN